MNSQKTAKRACVLVTFVVVAFLFTNLPSVGAQPLTHTVVKGDTLWDLCEKYYGDSDLWPKLWEMNPFITNPHLLKPGDVITLFETDALKARKGEPPFAPIPEAAKIAPVMKGIDVSTFTNVNAIGYLSPTKVKPLGHIRSSASSKLILGKGDTVFVELTDPDKVNIGDQLSVAESSPLLWHPLTNSRLGFTIETHGRLAVRERLKKPFVRAEIVESFRDVLVGDMVLPYESVSSCVRPVSTADRLYGNIVATKSQTKVIGMYSVVYLDSGYRDGIKRGYVFEAIKLHKAPGMTIENATLREITDKIVKDLPKEQYLLDFWKALTEGKIVYESSVGKLIVIETRPHTATAVVLSSLEELSNGDFIRGTSWMEAPDDIAGMPICSIE
jgi:LysM repeat protein